MSPFDKGGFWWLHLKRCIIGQAVGPQHILHHIDVGADVEGVAGEQAVELAALQLYIFYRSPRSARISVRASSASVAILRIRSGVI